MEHEIEEAQRQIRRSAAIIQDAFEGLTALQRLHNRVSEASPSARSLTDTSSAISTTQFTQDRAGSPGMPPNSMDPGHDVIVISAENSTLPPPSSTSTSVPVPQTQPRTSSSSIIAPLSPRGPRPSDPALAALGSELRTMTQSFRERVGEFDELRRAIAQYAQERHNRGVTAERARSRSPPPNAEPYNPVPYQPLYPEANSSSPEVVPPGTAQAASETNAPRRFDGRIRPIRGGMRPSNRPISLLRPREGNESETSLGMLVAARTAASSNDNNSVADTPTITPATISASVRSTGDRPRPVAFPVEDPYRSTGGRPSSRALPSNITARITRLAQEIQQEGARITQQAESLRSWINERNSRLDALRPSASVTATRNIFSGARPISTIGMDLNPTMILGEEYEPAPIPNLAPPPRFTTDLFPEPSMVPLSEIPRANEPVRGRELPTDTSPARSRRTPEGAVRARYLRQNVPTNWSAMVQSASNTREDRSGGVPWNSRRERTTDGPLSPPSRTIGLTGHRGGLRDAGTSMSASTGTALDDFEVESYNPANSVRAALAIARTRSQGRVMDVADDDEDFTDSRSYRVRRRYNADGDEEVIRIPLRRETSSSSLPGPELSLDRRPPPLELEDDGEEEDSWMEAISRLDTMSRRSAARVVPPEDSRHPPRMVRGGTQLGTAAPPPAAFPAYSANLAGRRSTRGWPRLSYAEEDALFAESEAQYERDLSAMRARAQALLSAAPSRALGGTTLPPPPPTTRPLSFMPTTQAPGSLWNDSSVRVRLRTRVNEALERQADSPTPPLERSRRERNGRDGAPRVQRHQRTEGSETERPMWGSPTPFYPSALPLPLVEDVGSLQARSRVFGSTEKIARMPRKRAVSQVGR